MEEKNKKEIVLEDLFFKNNGNIFDILKELSKYKTVLYYNEWLDCVLDAGILEEYIARLDTYIDAQCIQFTNRYDKITMYRFVEEYILGEIEYQKKNPVENYSERYDGMQLNLNPIIEIKEYKF